MENAFLPTATHVHALSSITFPKHNNMYAYIRCAFQRLQYFTGKKQSIWKPWKFGIPKLFGHSHVRTHGGVPTTGPTIGQNHIKN